MKFASLCIVYISTLIFAIVQCAENESKPCECHLQRFLGLKQSKSGFTGKPRYNPFSSTRSARTDELSPEEREERINRGFARFMQLLTFFGHVDNFFTGKAGDLIKVMGRALETGNEDEDLPTEYKRISRHSPSTRISNTTG